MGKNAFAPPWASYIGFGKCPGYVVDHVAPLCAGDPDAVSNIQWQAVQYVKAKDRIEQEKCRRRNR